MYISSDEELERFLNDEDAVVMINQYISKMEMVSCLFASVKFTKKKTVLAPSTLPCRSKISSWRCSHCLNAMKSKQVLSFRVLYILQFLCMCLSVLIGLNVSYEPTIEEKWTKVQEKVHRTLHARSGHCLESL